MIQIRLFNVREILQSVKKRKDNGDSIMANMVKGKGNVKREAKEMQQHYVTQTHHTGSCANMYKVIN